VGGGDTMARAGRVALPGYAPGTVLAAGGAGVGIGNFLYVGAAGFMHYRFCLVSTWLLRREWSVENTPDQGLDGEG
jgi:hypothetical protein